MLITGGLAFLSSAQPWMSTTHTGPSSPAGALRADPEADEGGFVRSPGRWHRANQRRSSDPCWRRREVPWVVRSQELLRLNGAQSGLLEAALKELS